MEQLQEQSFGDNKIQKKPENYETLMSLKRTNEKKYIGGYLRTTQNGFLKAA